MGNIVYIITDGTYYKIGVTSRLDKRLKQLQIGHPVQLTVAHTSEAMSRAKSYHIEKLAHAQLLAYKMHGEWFDVPLEKAIEAVESIAFANTLTEARSVPVISMERPSIADRIIQGLK